jgi:acylphosphatase
MTCRRCYVSGRVQGVFFRASTQAEAQRLGLTGYARNLRDGRVEVLACGAHSSVEELCAWLAQGPAHAQVSDVSCQAASDDPPTTFQVA